MKKYLNGIAYLVMIILNGLANGLPLNGKTTKELSDAYPNLFVPTGLTFSIWGIIYLLLLLFCLLPVFRFLSKQKTDDVAIYTQSIGYLFVINALANASWIVAWHYEYLAISVLLMLVILLTLIKINLNLQDILPNIKSKFYKFIFQAAFGIYLGWICVATIANMTALLVGNGLTASGLTETICTCSMILIGTGIGLFLLTKLQNPYIGLVIIWAFVGIIIARQRAEVQEISIIYTAFLGIVGMVSWLILYFKK